MRKLRFPARAFLAWALAWLPAWLGMALLALSPLPLRASVLASSSPWAPDFIRMQYAGQAGLLSLGSGYSWWHRHAEVSANYGYVPLLVADRRVHVLSERNAFSPGALRLGESLALEPLVAGVTANVTLGNRYQLFLPKAQRDYYWPDALYFWFFAGTRLGYLPPQPFLFRGVGAQIEVGTINQYLRSYRNNRDVGWEDILSLALSAQIYL
jgi:hypothetical protein